MKQDLILLIKSQTDHYKKAKTKKLIELMKNGLNGKIMIASGALKAKTYSYLTGSNNKDKKKNTRKERLV